MVSIRTDFLSFGIIQFKPIFLILFVTGLIVLYYFAVMHTELIFSVITGLALILFGFVISNLLFLTGSGKHEDIFNRLIVSESSDLFLTYNLREGKFDYVSSGIMPLLGYDHSSVLNQYDLSFLHPADRVEFNNFLDVHFLRLNRSFTTNLRMLKRDGSLIWVEMKGDVVVDESNELDHLVLNLRDVTAQMELEITNQQYQKSLEQAIQKNKMNVQDMEELAYLMTSHDLKEPLRTMSSYTRMVQQRYAGQLDKDGKEFLQYAVDAASRMANMMDDILSFSDVGANNTKVRTMNVEDALEEVKQTLGKKITVEGASIIYEKLPEIKADFKQVKQLLVNLIENAIKYRSQEKPIINIDVEQHTCKWLFKITDNGIGIPEEYHSTIFDVFRRLHGIGKIDGSGIGLAICKKIVQNHGGNIWVESQGEGKGSTFCFTLPIEPEMMDYPTESFSGEVYQPEIAFNALRFPE